MEFSRLLGKLAKLDKRLLQGQKLQELLKKLLARKEVWIRLLRGRVRRETDEEDDGDHEEEDEEDEKDEDNEDDEDDEDDEEDDEDE